MFFIISIELSDNLNIYQGMFKSRDNDILAYCNIQILLYYTMSRSRWVYVFRLLSLSHALNKMGCATYLLALSRYTYSVLFPVYI